MDGRAGGSACARTPRWRGPGRLHLALLRPSLALSLTSSRSAAAPDAGATCSRWAAPFALIAGAGPRRRAAPGRHRRRLRTRTGVTDLDRLRLRHPVHLGSVAGAAACTAPRVLARRARQAQAAVEDRLQHRPVHALPRGRRGWWLWLGGHARGSDGHGVAPSPCTSCPVMALCCGRLLPASTSRWSATVTTLDDGTPLVGRRSPTTSATTPSPPVAVLAALARRRGRDRARPGSCCRCSCCRWSLVYKTASISREKEHAVAGTTR